MAQQSKAQLLNEVHTLLKKRYKRKPDRGDGRLTILEAVIYGICHEGSTREQANQALSRFKDGFFDWNEIRVSSLDEIQGTLAGLSDTEERAYSIRRFLRQLFEKTYAFNLDALTKKPLKESLKVLGEYEAFSSDYLEASVLQHALGGHAIPIDAPCRRVLERLGIATPATDHAALRSLLERAVPKNRGAEFLDLIEDLAHDTCVETEPDCPRCELRKICPTGQARKEEAAAAAKQASALARQSVAAAARAAKQKNRAKPSDKVTHTPSAPHPAPASKEKDKPKDSSRPVKVAKAAKRRSPGSK
jgi:endonuclease III